MARVPAFQAGCCEFESRLPLHKESDESLALYFMSQKPASHSSILLMLFAIYGVLPYRVSALVRLVYLANDGGESRSVDRFVFQAFCKGLVIRIKYLLGFRSIKSQMKVWLFILCCRSQSLTRVY